LVEISNFVIGRHYKAVTRVCPLNKVSCLFSFRRHFACERSSKGRASDEGNAAHHVWHPFFLSTTVRLLPWYYWAVFWVAIFFVCLWRIFLMDMVPPFQLEDERMAAWDVCVEEVRLVPTCSNYFCAL